MALVQMVCPSCGGPMKVENNQFVCSYCQTMVLNIVEAKIDSDVTIMSPEEFEKILEASKKQFIVNIDDKFEVLDVDTMVINKKIKDANEDLNNKSYYGAINFLVGVPDNILSVERIRLLAAFHCINEQELLQYDGYIDNNIHYVNVIKLADEQTRATYQKIAEYCRTQHDAKVAMEAEVSKVKQLMDVGLHKEALAYTKEMCRKYPSNAFSWAYSAEIKCKLDKTYKGDHEYSMMRKCPDYSIENVPGDFGNTLRAYKITVSNYEKYSKNMVVPNRVLAFIFFIFLGGIATFFVKDEALLAVGFLAIIVSIILFFYVYLKMWANAGMGEWDSNKEEYEDIAKSKEQYLKLKSQVPDLFAGEHKVNLSSNSSRIIKAVVFFIIVAVIVLILKKIVSFGAEYWDEFWESI